ncbi:MAG: ABC transporter transmembrane domain-containing protein, partial [Anaerolineae bacterium]
MKTLKFVFGYTRNYIKPLAITIFAMLALVGVQLLAPQIVREMIAAVNTPDNLVEGLKTVSRLAIFALIIYIARAGLQFTRSYMAHVAGWGVVADARRQIYDHLQRLSLRFYEDKQTGDLMSRMVNDSDMFETLIAHAIPDTLVNVLMLVGVIAVLVSMNAQLMLLSLIPVPFIVVAARGFSKYVRPAFRRRQQELGELNATLNDNLSGIREIKAFTREDVEATRIGKHISHYRDSLLRALRLMATFHPFVEFSSSLGTIVLIYFGGRLALNQILPLEDLVAFFLYLEMFYQPIRALSGAWENVQHAMAGAERVSELLEETPEIYDRDDVITLSGKATGALSFRDVSFHYVKGDTVISDINLDIPANTVVAGNPARVIRVI